MTKIWCIFPPIMQYNDAALNTGWKASNSQRWDHHLIIHSTEFIIQTSTSFSRGRSPALCTAISAGICCILDPQIRNPHSRNHSAYQASHYPFSYCFLQQLTKVFPSLHLIPSVLLISCLIGQQQDKKRKEKVKNACDHSLLRPLSRSALKDGWQSSTHCNLMSVLCVCITLLRIFALWFQNLLYVTLGKLKWSSP